MEAAPLEPTETNTDDVIRTWKVHPQRVLSLSWHFIDISKRPPNLTIRQAASTCEGTSGAIIMSPVLDSLLLSRYIGLGQYCAVPHLYKSNSSVMSS